MASPHCHRCGSLVGPDDAFCPACGSPQLRLDVDEQLPAAVPAAESGSPAQSPSEAHSRRWAIYTGQHHGVDWHGAFRTALLIAVPIGVLTALPALSLGFLLWVVGGPVAVIALYHRHHPAHRLDGRGGFRIGALTGLFAAYISAALVAVLALIERYSLHLGAVMDREFTQRLQQSTAMVQTGPDTEAQMRSYLHFLLTPDGRAAMSLAGAAVTAVLTILLAGVGGTIGVRILGRQRTAPQ
jgi:hypothetical protein